MSRSCQSCGTEIPEDSPAAGLCPGCLLQLGLEHSAVSLSTPTPDPGPKTPDLPPIGPYRLLEVLGEGGMGVVYLAEQREPIERKVALKVIKLGMDSKEVIARFESERQALALMDHPSVARVYDAGCTEEGRPFFAMEFVQGVPITEYCDTYRLDLRERLQLFIRVCEGIQHAHQKGIIHRDIKPSNVLVKLQDGGKPVPKIIDFGLAKATAQRLTERTVFTQLGLWIGTPEHMSPEQAELSGLDVDTRTDIYSLGVLLYEVLVGAKPFDPEELRLSGFDELRRRIREEEPPRPSARLSRLGDSSLVASRNRRAELSGLIRQLEGDLDWVTMKALEKDRTRRYGTASELAADVRRHLEDQPVQAGPPSTVYRMKKFVRRHRLGVVGSAALAATLLLGVAGTGLGLVKARRAEEAARKEAEITRQVSDFLVDLFEVSDPGETRGNSVTAREILDRGAERIEKELRGQPLVRARLMSTIGTVYRKLGLYEAAVPLLERSLETQESVLGGGHPQAAEVLNSLAAVYYLQADYQAAERLFRRALTIREEALGSDHPAVASSLSNLSNVYADLGRNDEAKQLLERSLTIREKAFGLDHPEVAISLNNLALLYWTEGRYAEAEPLLEQSLQIEEKTLGSDHPEVATSLTNLGTLASSQGKLTLAEERFERALKIAESTLGPEHPNVATGLNNLAEVYRAQGRRLEAERLFRRALAIRQAVLGSDHPSVAESLLNLATISSQEGRRAEAETLLERSLAIRVDTLGPEHPDVATSLHRLGELRASLGRREEAEAAFQQALGTLERTLGADHPELAYPLIGLANLRQQEGDLLAAEALLRRALDIRQGALAREHPELAETQSRYAELLRTLGREDEDETSEVPSPDPAPAFRSAAPHQPPLG